MVLSSHTGHVFRVATYNVLSPQLCSAGYFPFCEASKCTDRAARLKLVLKKLESETDTGAVICLQEVSRTWCGPLHKFFNGKGYALVYSSYGSPFNGYMGVGIAYPLHCFKLEDCKVVRISETKKGGYNLATPQKWKGKGTVDKEEDAGIQSRAISTVVGLVVTVAERFRRAAAALLSAPRPQPESYPPWTDIEWRKNTSVMMRFRLLSDSVDSTDQPEVCVATYHMPCAFRTPCVIAAHCSLLMKAVQSFSGGVPYVIAGDFNFKPGSPSYELFTTGALPPEDAPNNPDEEYFGASHIEAAYEGDAWTIEEGLKPLVSAYKELNCSEPSFTNFARNKTQDKAFCDCIDYIFFSKGVKGLQAKAVDNLPHRSTLQPLKCYPSLKEPSDHLKIAATFSL